MKKIPVLFFVLFVYAPAQSSSEILAEMYSESGWVEVSSYYRDVRVFNKEFQNSGVPAIMARQTAPVSPRAMMSAIEDVGNYAGFLQDVYLERSDLLSRTPRVIEGYQYLDLPIISNRHWVFHMVRKDGPSGERIRYDWTLVSRNSKYRAFLDSMDVLYGEPTYLNENVGGWEIVPLGESGVKVTYRLYTDPAGWVPSFLVARANRIIAAAMVREMVREAMRRDRQ